MKLIQDFGVRALIATLIILTLSVAVIYCTVAEKVETLKVVLPGLTGIVGAVIGFYFREKVDR